MGFVGTSVDAKSAWLMATEDEFDLDQEIVMSTPGYSPPHTNSQDPGPRSSSVLETPCNDLTLEEDGDDDQGAVVVVGEEETSRSMQSQVLSSPRVTSYTDQSFGPIDDSNVMDLFYSSPFYDARKVTASNELVRKGELHIGELQELSNQVEYALLRVPPWLYFIVEQYRVDQTMASRHKVFFVYRDTIYEAPNVRGLCIKRIESCVERLRDTMAIFQQSSKFDTNVGRQWKLDASNIKWLISPTEKDESSASSATFLSASPKRLKITAVKTDSESQLEQLITETLTMATGSENS